MVIAILNRYDKNHSIDMLLTIVISCMIEIKPIGSFPHIVFGPQLNFYMKISCLFLGQGILTNSYYRFRATIKSIKGLSIILPFFIILLSI